MKDVDGKKLKYPKSVFFIISNEFCERFSYYGIRTILVLYFKNKLFYSEDKATVLYHVFTMLAYFFPLVGAMIADSWLGRFKTILYLSLVYSIGQLVLSGSAVPWFTGGSREQLTILGLVLIALGTGGIKPCVSAFGGDQFKLPQQELYLSTFFSLFYFAINSGSLISTAVTPILREEVHCFNEDSCYSVAFLVPAVLMIVSVVVFFAGKTMYKIKKPQGNIVFEVCKCMFHALSRKSKVRKSKPHETREHWLDYADDKYDRRMIEDIKSVLKVLKLFIPLPIFWALFDQQGSRWTFQATRMDGEVFGFLIKPDQFQVVNPLFIVLFIPIFQYAVYPVIEKVLFISTPLRKLTVGGFLACLAFVISGMVELRLENTYARSLEPGFTQIRLYNTVPCDAKLSIPYITKDTIDLDSLGVYKNLMVPSNVTNVGGRTSIKVGIEFDSKCPIAITLPKTVDLHALNENSASWWITPSQVKTKPKDFVDKSTSGLPKVRLMFNRDEEALSRNVTVNFYGKLRDKEYNWTAIAGNDTFSNFTEVNHDIFYEKVDGKEVFKDVSYRLGGVYTIVGYMVGSERKFKSIQDVEPNSMSMLWLLPQYVVITAAEIMFSITGLEFAFTQAPASMKSLLTASWLLTVAFGNLVVVIVAEAHFFKRQVFEFFLFAGLMFIDMIILAVMAMFYKYVEVSSSNENSTSENIDLDDKKGISNATFSEDF